MLQILQRLFGRSAAAPDRSVIDMAPYRDSVKRLREDEQAVARSRDRVAAVVGGWARDCINGRCKAPLPTRLPRSCSEVIRSWLDGLSLQEIYELSKVDRFYVLHHIYGEDRIVGLRDVQPLPPNVLVFPPPVIAAAPQADRSAGGGPKVRRMR